MKRLMTALGIAAVATATVVGYYALRAPAGGKLPKNVIEQTQFSRDFDDVVGDANGVVCLDPRLIFDGKEYKIGRHTIFGKNFRKMTPEERRQATIEDIQKTMEDSGLACIGPDGVPFLPEAYAGPPKCQDCDGGDCHSYACAAELQSGDYCTFHGTTCIIAVICCTRCQNPCP